ncbi:MAG: metal-dependent hydrolase [Candidatus Bathyarchaeota archaeon]|nr:MAG: metal-dependent hydrolase [Candidatus Bathyarchaeota archaeon]
MFAVGHLSLGYLSAKTSAKLMKQEINISLVFLLSLLPDVDILIPSMAHRTITHSIFVITIGFLPFLLAFKTKALPYFIAIVQHSLVGDFITGGLPIEGIQLFWPITKTAYGLAVRVYSNVNIMAEWGSFIVAGVVMFKTKDIQRLLRGQLLHLSLFVPALALSLPTFVQFPLSVPLELFTPHIIYLILFALSISSVFAKVFLRN